MRSHIRNSVLAITLLAGSLSYAQPAAPNADAAYAAFEQAKADEESALRALKTTRAAAEQGYQRARAAASPSSTPVTSNSKPSRRPSNR